MASPPLEHALGDLRTARFIVHKLGETFDSFQVNCCSIFTLAEQWKNLQSSFGEISRVLETRVKDLESKEIENTLVANSLQNIKKEVELKQNRLEFGEKSLSEKIAVVELRQNEVKKWIEVIEIQKRGIREREMAVEAKERELLEGMKRVREVDENEARVRKVEMEVNECRKAVELEKGRVSKVLEEVESREKRVEERCKELELKESVLDDRCKELEMRESRVDDRCKELELREREINERGEVLEAREMGLKEEIRVVGDEKKGLLKDRQALEFREKELDEIYTLVESRENEIGERLKGLESKEKELNLREEEMKVQHEELKSKEKDIVERLNAIKRKENDLRDACKALKDKEKDINVRFVSVGAREEKFKKRARDVELKEMELDAHRIVIEAKEGVLNENWDTLEFNEKEADERSKAIDLKEKEVEELRLRVEMKEKEMNEAIDRKEKEVEELRLGVESKEKQINESLQALELKEKQIDECCKAMEVKEKVISERCKKLDMKEKQINRRKKAQELREKQVEDTSKQLELKEKEVDGRCQMLQEKEKQFNDLHQALELKQKLFKEISQAVELKENEIKEISQAVEMKDKQFKDLSVAVESKEKQLSELSQARELKETQCVNAFQTQEFKKKQVIDPSEQKQTYVLPQEIKLQERPTNGQDKQYLVNQNEVRATGLNGTKDNQLHGVKQKKTCSEKLEVKGKQIIERSEALESKQKQITELSEGRKLEEKQMDNHDKMCEVNDKEVHVPFGATGFKKPNQTNQLHGGEQQKACSKNLDCKEKQIADGALNLKLNQTSHQRNSPALKEGQKGDIAHKSSDKQITELQDVVMLNDNQVNDIAPKNEMEQKQSHNFDSNLVVNSNGSESGSFTFRATDGKALQLYLNERIANHGSMKDEVDKLLKSSSNPAELVLGAMEGFFPPHSSKDDVPAFPLSVVRSSCLLLLEHLMEMKPKISEVLKKKATMVAKPFKAKLKVFGNSEVVVMVYLLLVATYNLNVKQHIFPKDELRRLCGVVDQHRLAPRLRQRLGLLKRTESGGFEGAVEESIQPDSLKVTNALDSSSVKIPGDIHSLCRNMNGDGVRSYLIEHVKELNDLRDKILDALKYASDPAKLVLDVCKISVSDHDKSRTEVNKSTCIFLLQQLLKASTSMSPEVIKEAKDFADFLKAKMKGKNIPVDHYIFLQFLASFKLKNSYPPDELLSYFNVLYCGVDVYRPEENTYLCFALGLGKKIPGFIKSLIDQQKLLLAVKYICVFKLERDFQPVPLLERYWEFINNKVSQIRREGNYKDKINAEDLELTTLKSILTCIFNFKLESKLPPDRFIARTKELEKEKERRMTSKCPLKRNASPGPSIETPLQLEKRSRVETTLHSPTYLPLCPPGPPPRPHSFGPPDYVRPMSNEQNLPLNSSGVAPGHFIPGGMYPVDAPLPIYRGDDQAWANYRRF